MTHFFNQALSIWGDGGWLMLPLLLLAVFIYYTVLELFFHLDKHFLIRSRVHKMSDIQIRQHLSNETSLFKSLLHENITSPKSIRGHFKEVRNEYISPINSQIKFLTVLITAGPLFGLLGTVTGMFFVFTGMINFEGDKFDSVVKGISEALITTQIGLIVSIPAYVILSLIIQKRNLLERCIMRLEHYNNCLIFKNSNFPKNK